MTTLVSTWALTAFQWWIPIYAVQVGLHGTKGYYNMYNLAKMAAIGHALPPQKVQEYTFTTRIAVVFCCCWNLLFWFKI